jgi:UDP-N-acetylglucosamine 1-carboxyvinyltransferase
MGLAADGQTEIHELKHVWRGYENLMEKMTSLGADIQIEPGNETNA